jgi:hypothetical protein
VSSFSRFRCDGPIRLPGGLPDLDFLAEDESSSTLVIAELKWVRKPVQFFERLDRDKQIQDGITQLKEISDFLRGNPIYLRERGRASKSICDFAHVHYLLIARGHFIWVDPNEGYPVVEHECFKEIVARSPTLRSAVTEVLRFEWLPVEGRDFVVRYEHAMANGVVIESEVFHATS